MTEHLPEVYTTFRTAHPSVAVALDELGSAVDEAGPLDPKTMRLVKLSIAVGAGAEGAVRSNVRKALYAGATPDEIHHVSAEVQVAGGHSDHAVRALLVGRRNEGARRGRAWRSPVPGWP